MKTTLKADVEAALAALPSRAINHVYLIACGGSLSIMFAGKYFLDRHSRSLAADTYNADEFVCRSPARLGLNSLVILCSQTGTTAETVRAATLAKSRGALCIGMTLDIASPLAKAVDFPVAYQASYTTGIPIDACDSNYAVLFMLLAGIVKQVEGVDLIASLLPSLSRLQGAIDAAHRKCAPLLYAYAARYKDKSAIYTLASGPAYSAAYSFSTCVLMEMQWYNSQAIHANEFFHGPFEIVDKEACFIVLLGSDETRPLTERARDFLMKFGAQDNILVLDAVTLDFQGINDKWQAYLLPLVFFDVLWKFAYQLAELRQHPMLEGRRYMKKLVNY